MAIRSRDQRISGIVASEARLQRDEARKRGCIQCGGPLPEDGMFFCSDECREITIPTAREPDGMQTSWDFPT